MFDKKRELSIVEFLNAEDSDLASALSRVKGFGDVKVKAMISFQHKLINLYNKKSFL